MIRSKLNLLLYRLTAPFRIIFRVPAYILSTPRRLWGLSLPLRVAIVVGLLMVCGAVIALLMYFLNRGTPELSNWLPTFAILLVLSIVVPFVVYYAVKYWLMGEISPWPEIDDAWAAGMAALGKHRMDISSVPVFLILGTKDDAETRNLMKASDMEMLVEHEPGERTAPLHWYISSDAVFLVCNLGRLTALTRLAHYGGGESSSEISQTFVSDNYGGTIVESGEPARQPRQRPEGDARMTIYETFVEEVGAPGSVSQAGDIKPAMIRPSALSGDAARSESAKLQHVCRLLRRARQPVCPINGVASVLSFDLLMFNDQPVEQALRHDIATIGATTRLRCPIVALVAGMESENGFQELVRRVGFNTAKRHRFGKGGNVWNVPTSAQLTGVTQEACRQFEVMVYKQFKKSSGLMRVGNTHLFSLLCKIRSYVTEGLARALSGAFAIDQGNESNPHSLMFMGCYFAATGVRDDQQAFVASVFDLMIKNQAELEWTPESARSDRVYQTWSDVLMLLNGLLAIAFVGLLVWNFVLRE